MHGICNISMIPVRAEASDKSEMVSQLLFGEAVEVVDQKDGWRKVRTCYDDYTGWIDKKQILIVPGEEVVSTSAGQSATTLDIVQIVIFRQSNIIPVVLGSTLPAYKEKKFHFGNTEFSFDGNVMTAASPEPAKIIEHAYMYLNAPYLWGGRSPFGIDCSGYTQMVFKLCGIPLKRDSHQQAEQGTRVVSLQESKPGDLAFFDNADGKIVHVGIVLSNNKIIHASGKVKVDQLDQQGILNEETNKYTHHLKTIRRIV